jgi:ribose transport system permease protein
MSHPDLAEPLVGPRTNAAVQAWLRDHPWIWVYLGSILMWVAISVVNGRVNLGVISAVFALAPFLVLVGIGQMFVISLGNGHTDLTVPNILSLSAFTSTLVIGTSGSILAGLATAAVLAAAAALLNTGIIVGLRVPPMVATLAAGLILQSATTAVAGRGGVLADPELSDFTHFTPWGISLLGVLCVLVTLFFWFVLRHTTYGRRALAVGQSQLAAVFSGIPVGRVVLISYFICALLAATAGTLLGSFSAPSLTIGDPYLLNSIAVVVLGGSLIAGGRSNLPGIWGAALFLLLLNTLLNTLNISVASQNIVKGALIILVLALVGAEKKR